MMVAAGPARAQLIQRYLPSDVTGTGILPGVTVLTRSRPDYDRPGVQVGAYTIRPLASEGFGYNSNVFGLTPATSSALFDTQASLQAASNWSRHSLVGYASVDNTQYLALPSEATTSWTVGAEGGYDIGRDVLTLGANHVTSQSTTNIVNAISSQSPISQDTNDVRLSYKSTFGRVTLVPFLDYSQSRYANTIRNGFSVNQSFQDVDTTAGGVTISYELSPNQNIVLVPRVVGSHYPSPQAGQPNPDATSYYILAGFQSNADSPIRYVALGGYADRVYASPGLKSHTSPVAEVDVIWTPTGLTTVTGTLQRVIEDSSDQGGLGFVYTTAKAQVDHELLRNVTLTGFLQFENVDYLNQAGSNRTLSGNNAKQYTGRLEATWLINRTMRLAADYTYTNRESNFVNNSYRSHVALLRLQFGL